MKVFYTLLFLVLFSEFASAGDCGNGRYLEPIFSRVDVTRNITYARKKQSDGAWIDLKYDVYEPHGDSLEQRPVMLLIHGGAYLKLLDQNSPDIVLMCNYFAQRGYVTVSIDYRQEPNLLGLLSEEVMVKAVSRALIDTKEAVDHLFTTYQNGNPFRIDTSKAIIGGVSAGAVSAMFICFLDSLAQLPQQYQQWIIDANGPDADYILRHKFDLVRPKVAISISGALLDTNWIVPKGIDILLDHGSVDQLVPYDFGHPFNLSQLPILYGGKAMYPRMEHEGIRVEFEDWIGRGHVPFMNLTFPDIIFNFINQPILDSTERHIAHFCYRLLDCSTATSVKQSQAAGTVAAFPNPSKGNFSIELPQISGTGKWKLSMYDVIGRIQYEKEISGSEFISINENFSPGIYLIKLADEKSDMFYIGKMTIVQ